MSTDQPLRLVVERIEPSACSIRETYTEVLECGHTIELASPKPATRRRCIQCATAETCRACNQPADLAHRVADLIAWANSRIEQCRRDEEKFGSGAVSIEAATERRALQAVLNQLEDY